MNKLKNDDNTDMANLLWNGWEWLENIILWYTYLKKPSSTMPKHSLVTKQMFGLENHEYWKTVSHRGILSRHYQEILQWQLIWNSWELQFHQTRQHECVGIYTSLRKIWHLPRRKILGQSRLLCQMLHRVVVKGFWVKSMCSGVNGGDACGCHNPIGGVVLVNFLVTGLRAKTPDHLKVHGCPHVWFW